jgi:phosphatidylinositol 4-kinase
MKPILDRMIHDIAESLSGSERDFYDREFTFFHEVTSISGKLKPYIKKSKSEKKVYPAEQVKTSGAKT